ncbi:MAG TPA: S9 family peptidase [Methanothrix sp.]|nr:S9 family peptidase [Methanothrix sp.]
MMKNYLIILIFAVLLASLGEADGRAGEPTRNNGSLISRDLLFGNPDRITTRISPDGLSISFLAPKGGVLNIWVGPANAPEKAKPITNDTYRGIRSYLWSYTSRHILYVQDANGDENWRIYSVNLSSGKILDLTPFKGVRAELRAISINHPHELIIAMNKRDPQYFDLYRLNFETGNMTLILENKEFSDFTIDNDFHIRMASRMTEDGGVQFFTPANITPSNATPLNVTPSENISWEPLMKIEMEDSLTTGFSGFNKSNAVTYLIDSRGRNTAALYAYDMETKKSALLAEDPRSDLYGIMIHPKEKTLQAVAFFYDRVAWKVLDPAIKPDIDFLNGVEDGDMSVVSRSLDDKIWVVVFTRDNGPARYYRYDRTVKEATFLFTDREKLEGLVLAKMIPAVIKSRDGLDLVCYYTLPPHSDEDGDGIPEQPLAMVLYVHGGPWSRDYWGFDSIHQWLANRGYAVLSVNFRGSTGLGKSFINAGNMQWGGKMHDDLLDAVNWSVQQKIADPEKIAIMGGSYGGYAALAGLTFTPQTFACAVDIVGPSNLITLLETIPPYWKPEIEQFTKRVGDFRTEPGRKLLRERSPLSYVQRIERPLLIGQGANDPRVKQNESDQIVKAMQAKSLPVTYVLYVDEGHGFARPENRLSFYAITEAFLAAHLGGSFQTIGKDFAGANLTVPAGAGEVPGLEEALEKRE